MRGLLTSVRYTIRLLLKSPTFTIIAVLILGVGIGANTAIFSLLDADKLADAIRQSEMLWTLVGRDCLSQNDRRQNGRDPLLQSSVSRNPSGPIMRMLRPISPNAPHRTELPYRRL